MVPGTISAGVPSTPAPTVGPEIAGKAAADPRVLDVCEPVVYSPSPPAAVEPGLVSATAGRAAYDVLVRAVEDTMAGRVDNLVPAVALTDPGTPLRGTKTLTATASDGGGIANVVFAGKPSTSLPSR